MIIGEILSNGETVKKLLSLDNEALELMGVVVLGYGIDQSARSARNDIEAFLL